MRFEWPKKHISEIADVVTGFPFKGEKYLPAGHGVRVVRGDNVSERFIRWGEKEKCWDNVTDELLPYILRAGDVVIGMDGSKVGKNFAAISKSEDGILLAQRVARLRAKEGVCQDFLRYLICNHVFTEYVQAVHTGTSIPHISKGQIQRFEVSVPPLEVQEKIASILTAIDDRITLLRETNATLEAIAQALFKSWFVDFDPVHANIAAKSATGGAAQGSTSAAQDTTAGMPEAGQRREQLPPMPAAALDATTAALFPDSFEESELGLVPQGWRLVPFGELLTHTIGGDWGDETPGQKNDIRVAIIRGTDIPDLQSGTAPRVPVRYTSSKKLGTRKLQDGDLVLEVSGGSKDQPTGRVLYITDLLLGQFDCPVEPASFCRLLRPASRDIGVLLAQQLTYIYSIGKTWEYQNQSTGIANFQTAHFLETELVAVPSPEVLAEFSAIVRPMIDRAHQSQIRELTHLRDTLLPRLISGQLLLPDAEATLRNTDIS